MIKEKFYAHTLEGKPDSDWQLLSEHLHATAERAGMFANVFNAEAWGNLAGLWHDIGKYSHEFQLRLQGGKKVDHSTAGAKHAFELLKGQGKLLAYAIAGHHVGLPDGKSNENSCLVNRLEKTVPDYSGCPAEIKKKKSLCAFPFEKDEKRFGFQLSFFVRMIFSCLVDADFLDTEAFMDQERSLSRGGYSSIEKIDEKLTYAINKMRSNADKNNINDYRNSILEDCIYASEHSPGLFSLTVPTGGGKTLSSLSFAVKHALKYKKDRVIYVIPYTSIIEQNAAVFRGILGDNAVLEHHSSFIAGEEDRRSRLAAENWDAPIIVTTNVQFFESLFASRTSRCRKIHNIANSVVILDEAQMLPVHLLRPCIEALRELADVYRSSIVLCTATQPALVRNEKFENGLEKEDVREIVTNPSELYDVFKRVRLTILGLLTDDELAEKLKKTSRSLCIVNTRKHARLTYEKIKNVENCFHLSSLMCPEHRSEILKEICRLLKEGKPCRVVSTQLIEAGVDVDFPVVYRASAGLDSIAQAAGRCNREGRMPEKGCVYVFTPEDGMPPGHLRHTAETAELVLPRYDDPLSLEAVEEYFRRLYWMKGDKLDEKGILRDLDEGKIKGNFPFSQVDTKFQMIDTLMEPLIVNWRGNADEIVNGLRYAEFTAPYARKAQRYTIQIPEMVMKNLKSAGSVEVIRDQYALLINDDLYSDELGLCPENPVFHQIEHLIA